MLSNYIFQFVGRVVLSLLLTFDQVVYKKRLSFKTLLVKVRHQENMEFI